MILEIAVSLIAVAGFGAALWVSRIDTVARAALATTQTGLSSITDSALTDDEKEAAVRRAGFALIRSSLSLALRLALSLTVAALPILLCDALGLIDASAVTALMLRLDYILAVSLGAALLIMALRRLGAPTPVTEAYSASDRMVHVLAFSGAGPLKAASWLEDRLFSAPLPEPTGPPVFITSLARGGTTALLNALSDMPGVATHTYRDMPFITAPALSDWIAGGARRSVARRQRAHGDGLAIDLDSPEAFEEVIWQMYWPEKMRCDRIELWTAGDRKPDAERFLTRQMAKVLRARFGTRIAPGAPVRYCSKNNANLARLSFLPSAFPGCRIVVALRRPDSHAASLLRQHRNFRTLQAEDPFVRRYMRDIGHFEFGLDYRPLGFRGFDPARRDPLTPDHWLDYWIHAFREVEARLNDGQALVLVDQDRLRSAPQRTMQALAETLNLSTGRLDVSGRFRLGPDLVETDVFDPALLAEARELYATLLAQALQS
ncbi:MAG: sulfotransferase [Pseudomonadota bacterium]